MEQIALTKEIWDACINIVKYQHQQIIILNNFGMISIWMVEDFDTKGIGKDFNTLVGKEITAYINNFDFYSPSGKSILEQAQGNSRITMKFGHDNYIRLLSAD